MRHTSNQHVLSLVLAATALSGCSAGIEGGTKSDSQQGQPIGGLSPNVRDKDRVLADGNVDYNAALRTMALKLTGNYPTLAEIKEIQTASDPASTFAKRMEAYLADPRFAALQKNFWSDTFRMGGTIQVNGTMLNLDAAPTFATMLVVKELPFTKLFTETANTCLKLNADGSFAADTCANQTTPTVGVLTDPGVQGQFFSSLALRRVRWIQETFMCQAFPAETGGKSVQHPGGAYTSPWPFDSIAGGPSARINFQADDSLICANCHTTLNHIAPLFAYYDEAGALKTTISVHTPSTGSPFSVSTDWLPAGQSYAWRYNKNVTDIASLGQAIAADPGLATCVATRVWNWAFSHGDVVGDKSTLPPEITDQLAADFRASNYNVKKLIREVFTNPNFVRY